MTEYKYYLAAQKWLNTNTNIIQLPNNNQIQISFGFSKMNEYYIQKRILLSVQKGFLDELNVYNCVSHLRLRANAENGAHSRIVEKHH